MPRTKRGQKKEQGAAYAEPATDLSNPAGVRGPGACRHRGGAGTRLGTSRAYGVGAGRLLPDRGGTGAVHRAGADQHAGVMRRRSSTTAPRPRVVLRSGARAMQKRRTTADGMLGTTARWVDRERWL